MAYDRESSVGRFLAGDAQAHSAVVRWVAQVLTSARFRMLRDEWSDLHQESLRRILESLAAGRFDATRDFRVYCQGVARYTASAALDRRIRRFKTQEDDPPEVGVGPDAEDLVVTRDLVDGVMDVLSEDCCALFQMLFYEQMEHAEIAERLGISSGALRSRLFRCLTHAREGAARIRSPRGAGQGPDR